MPPVLFNILNTADSDASDNALVVRATGVEDSRRFLSLNYAVEYVTTHLQEIPQRIRWGSWRE